MKKYLLLVAFLLFALIGCGSGGGDSATDTPETPDNPTPTPVTSVEVSNFRAEILTNGDLDYSFDLVNTGNTAIPTLPFKIEFTGNYYDAVDYLVGYETRTIVESGTGLSIGETRHTENTAPTGGPNNTDGSSVRNGNEYIVDLTITLDGVVLATDQKTINF